MSRGHRSIFALFSAIALLLTGAQAARAQQEGPLASPPAYFTVRPLSSTDMAKVRAASTAAATSSIPLWNYSITSPINGVNYSGNMVGRSPFSHGARTTQIPTYIVPLIIKMPDGGVFNPTTPDSACSLAGTPLSLVQNSPLMQATDIPMNGVDIGTGQYVDEFQRANFWQQISAKGSRYHTALNPVTLNPVTVNVPSGDGTTNSTAPYGGCGSIGVMNINWFDPYVQSTILPSLASQGVGPGSFPLFVLYNVVMTDGTPSLTGNCCILGYHSAFFSSALQTYSPADFDTTRIFLGTGNISAMSHEVAEWMDDPMGTNPTPAWGHTGQVSGCQNNLEVGDPLSGTLFPGIVMPNGYTYTPQELAFYSWFYRQSPSIGAGGTYSNNGTFSTSAGAVCN